MSVTVRRYGRALWVGGFIGRFPLRFAFHVRLYLLPIHPHLGVGFFADDEEEETSVVIGLLLVTIEAECERLRPYPEPSDALLAWAADHATEEQS